MHPTLFRIGDFPIGTYGLMVALGFLLGIQYVVRAARKIPVAPERIYDLSLVIIIAALIGSRIAYLIVEWDWFMRDPFSLIFSRQGYVFYGGFLGGGAAVIFFARRWELPVRSLADAYAPGVALGHFFGRLGCYLNGCCHGDLCSLDHPLTRFPRVLDAHGNITGSPAFLEQLERELVMESDRFALPVHPTQLYEAAGLLVLFLVLHALYRRVKWPAGMLFLLYAVGYAVLRFCVEFFRGDPRGWVIPNRISTSQGIALAVLIAAPFVYRKLRRMPAETGKPSGGKDSARGCHPPRTGK